MSRLSRLKSIGLRIFHELVKALRLKHLAIVLSPLLLKLVLVTEMIVRIILWGNHCLLNIVKILTEYIMIVLESYPFFKGIRRLVASHIIFLVLSILLKRVFKWFSFCRLELSNSLNKILVRYKLLTLDNHLLNLRRLIYCLHIDKWRIRLCKSLLDFELFHLEIVLEVKSLRSNDIFC